MTVTGYVHICANVFSFWAAGFRRRALQTLKFDSKNFGMGLAYSLVELRYAKCGSGLMF